MLISPNLLPVLKFRFTLNEIKKIIWSHLIGLKLKMIAEIERRKVVLSQLPDPVVRKRLARRIEAALKNPQNELYRTGRIYQKLSEIHLSKDSS